jgi:hypothetical protein
LYSWRGYARLEDHLKHGLGREHVEVGSFDGSGLLEHGARLDILGRKEVGPLVAVLLGDVTANGARLVEDEAVVVLGGVVVSRPNPSVGGQRNSLTM